MLENRSGNCIELSILYASILESMDFEPVIVFPQGHAIVGVVMGSEAYPSCSVLPPDYNDKLIVLGSAKNRSVVLCFESTMCANKQSTFSMAVDSAFDTISNQLSSINSRNSFTLVKKERMNGVNPKMD